MTNQIRGAVLLCAAMLSFSASGTFVKLAADNIPPMESVFFRGIIGMFIVMTIAAGKGVSLLGNRKGLLAARGIVGTTAMMMFFYALSKIPVADAILLNQTTPIFVLPLAVIFLKEKISKVHLAYAGTALVGVALVIRPEDGLVNFPGVVALISAAFAAVAYVLVSQLNKTENTYAIVFWFMCISAVGSLPFMLNVFVAPDTESLLLLVGVGVTGTIGQLLLTWAYHLGEAGRLSVLGSMGAIYGVGWDFFLWDHVPDMITTIGGIVVITSCSALQMKRTTVRTENK